MASKAKSSGSNSSVFNALLNELLARKNELKRDQVLNLVEEKKNKVGGGYLTDQGALFLVASDVGVGLRYEEAKIKLGDLENNLSDVSIVARILTIGPPRKFIRRSDSSTGFVSKLVVYDGTSTVPVSLWNPTLAMQVHESEIRPGTAVRLSKAYTRAGLDGMPVLNLSAGGSIEKLDASDPFAVEIPQLEEQITTNLEVKSQHPVIIRGKVSGQVRKADFTRKDGTQSYLTSFGLNFIGSGKEKRVVLWENPNPVFESIKENESVTLLGVKTKETEFQGTKSIEFHGDEATLILEKWEETSKWMKQLADKLNRDLRTSLPTQEPNQQKRQQVLAFVARILSIGGHQDVEKDSAHVLICDSTKRKISLTALNAAAKDMVNVQRDDVILCKPDSLDQIGLKAICTQRGSISKVKSERKDIPNSSSLFMEIERLTSPSIVSLDVMSLSESSSREVQTREGLVKRAELSIGDPTGEIKIYAWRGLSRLLEKISAGMRLKLEAVEVQSHEGKKFIVFKNYSSVNFLE